MFGFLKKKSAEVSVLLERIELAQRAMPDELRHLSGPLLKNLSATVRSKWTREHIDNYVAQARAGESHEAFICNFLVHAVADILESGRYHVYRGVLGIEGTQYRALFEHAISTMVARGGYTKEWADENLRKAVYKGIKEAG